MRQKRWWPLGLLSAIAFFGCTIPTLIVAQPKASLYVVGGEVGVLTPGISEWKPATSCFVLGQGYTLRTGADGEAVVSLAGGGKLFLDTGSELSIQALAFADQGQSAPLYNLGLPQGTAYIDSPGQAGGAVLVRSSSGVVGLYQGTGWVQRDGASVGLDLINGKAILAHVGVMTDTPVVRVVELGARSSVLIAQTSTPIAISQTLLDGVTLILATGPEAYQRLSSAGSLQGALEQLAQDAAQDPDLAGRLGSLGLSLPGGSISDLPPSELALLSLEGMAPAQWPALLAASDVWDVVQLQELETPEPPSLVQQAGELPPEGAAPGQSEDKGRPGERPPCGRDAAKPPTRGAMAGQVGKPGELQEIAQSRGGGPMERGQGGGLVLNKPLKSHQMEARGKPDEVEARGKSSVAGADKGKGIGQGQAQDKGSKPEEADSRGQGQGGPKADATPGVEGVGQGQKPGGDPDEPKQPGGGPKAEATPTAEGQDAPKGQGKPAGGEQAAGSTPTPEPTPTPQATGGGDGSQGGGQGGSGGQGGGGDQSGGRSAPADPTPTPEPPAPTPTPEPPGQTGGGGEQGEGGQGGGGGGGKNK